MIENLFFRKNLIVYLQLRDEKKKDALVFIDNVQKEGGRFLQKKEGIKLPVMSKLNVDQKTIKDLFQSKKSDFLIPDYQRPYAWSEAECRTLWDDIFSCLLYQLSAAE